MADSPKIHGWGSTNFYRDMARNANVGTATLAVTPDSPFSYFGFVDLFNRNYWTEQNLRYQLGAGPLHASFQYVSASSLPVQLWRFGVLWNMAQTPGLGDLLAKAGIFAVGIDLHLLEINSQFGFSKGLNNLRRGFQPEPYIAGNIPGTSGKIFYEGWLDMDLDWSKGQKFQATPVSDFLVGANLVGDPTTTGSLRLVTEGRYNDYYRRAREDNPALKNVQELNPFGAEVGASYFIAF